MARLTWMDSGTRFFETGLDMQVLFPKTSAGYGKGEAWSSLMTVNEQPSGGEPQKFYSSNTVYGQLMSAEEFGGTLEAYDYSDTFAECDGQAIPTPGMKIGQQTRKPFGLCYRSKIGNDIDLENHAYKLMIIYNALTQPTEKNRTTINDSPEATNFSWTISTTPEPTGIADLKPTSFIELDSRTITPEKMQQIEDILYGTADVEPRLPLPNEIYTILTTSG